MYHWARGASQLELMIEDVSLETIFVEALMALGDELTETRGGESVTHEVELQGADASALLAAWVGELVRLAETNGFIPERAVSIELGETRVAALVGGQRRLPQGSIKSVTFERLELDRVDGAWSARILLSL